MRRAFRWFWKTGMLSTFLAGLFAVLPIMITVVIIALGVGFLGGAVLSAYKFGAEESLPTAGPPQQQAAQGVPPEANLPSPEALSKIPALESVTSMDPDNAGAWTELGNLYFDTNNYESAIRSYKKSLELNPQNFNAREMLKQLERNLREN